MNKIGEVAFGNSIKILDAFDFPEEFSRIDIEDIKPGIWLAFNKTKFFAMLEDTVVSEFFIVEKAYYEETLELLNWEKHSEIISIEKGVIGIFNADFNESASYIDEMDSLISTDLQAGVHTYAVCKTMNNDDGYYSFDVIKDDNKIVALRINFEEN